MRIVFLVAVLSLMGLYHAQAADQCAVMTEQFNRCTAQGLENTKSGGSFDYVRKCLDQFPYPSVCGSGAARSTAGGGCESESENVDWVFRDPGACQTFRQGVAGGLSPFEAVVNAQGHSPAIQQRLQACQTWATPYIASTFPTTICAGNGPITRTLSATDCSCPSVVPSGDGQYRVSNRCDPLEISVRFRDAGSGAMSVWIPAGQLGGQDSSVIRAPSFRIPSINAVLLQNASSSVVCPME